MKARRINVCRCGFRSSLLWRFREHTATCSLAARTAGAS